MATNSRLAGGRRDEWSEGAVACLLDAYESKWELRRRAKLKSRDWDDVARRVSGRIAGARLTKTPSQCKNKIESMKKRYRSESAGGGLGFSRWPLFGRIHRLMRWKNDGKEPLEGKGENKEHSQAQMDAERIKSSYDAYNDRENKETMKKKRKILEREEGNDFDVIESIQSLAETALKVEKLRMEAMRDVEKIWARAEAKKGELDLKRTEITAKTQLKIASLLYKSSG